MSNASPLIVAEWRKNARETIRVTLDSFKGTRTVDIRSWFADTAGEVKPTKAGATLAIRHLPALADAIAKALAEAKARGFLSEGGPS